VGCDIKGDVTTGDIHNDVCPPVYVSSCRGYVFMGVGYLSGLYNNTGINRLTGNPIKVHIEDKVPDGTPINWNENDKTGN